MTYAPGGMDEFFAEAGEPAPRREVPPPSDVPPDVAKLTQAGARYGLTVKLG